MLKLNENTTWEKFVADNRKHLMNMSQEKKQKLLELCDSKKFNIFLEKYEEMRAAHHSRKLIFK